jgi:hypothetical protein
LIGDDLEEFDDIKLAMLGIDLPEGESKPFEGRLRKGLADSRDRLILLGHYFWAEIQSDGFVSLSRFKNVCWLIDNCPASAALQSYGLLNEFPQRLWDEAAEMWGIKSSNPNAEIQILYNAASFFSKRVPLKAVSLFEAAVLLGPGKTTYFDALCSCYWEQFISSGGDEKSKWAEKILEAGRKAFLYQRRDMSLWPCYRMMIEASLHLGQLEVTRSFLTEKLIDIAEQDNGFVEGVLGQCFLIEGNLEQAKNFLLSVADPGCPEIWKLARLLLNKGAVTSVVGFLSTYLDEDVREAEVTWWLDEIQNGLIP